jgi:hypothetical protein
VTGDAGYLIALFDSVSHAIKAEKILKKAGIPHKIIPVPRQVSSDCGICVRILPDQKGAFIQAIGTDVQVNRILEMPER